MRGDPPIPLPAGLLAAHTTAGRPADPGLGQLPAGRDGDGLYGHHGGQHPGPGHGRRRREFALQRLAGSTGGQVLRMMTVEAALVAAVGIALGTAVSTTTLVPFSVAATDSPFPAGPTWIYLAVVATAVTLE